MCEIYGQRVSGTTKPDDEATGFVAIGGMRAMFHKSRHDMIKRYPSTSINHIV